VELVDIYNAESDRYGHSRSDSGPKVGEDLSYFTGFSGENTTAAVVFVIVGRRRAVDVMGKMPCWGIVIVVGRREDR
jgi:hypothetical protein